MYYMMLNQNINLTVTSCIYVGRGWLGGVPGNLVPSSSLSSSLQEQVLDDFIHNNIATESYPVIPCRVIQFPMRLCRLKSLLRSPVFR